MSTYAIGDIQGCYRSLTALLEGIAFRPGEDRLWLVGDLVNRGPESLEVLRWARALGDPHVVVLGNHDLHLLGRGWGLTTPKPLDTLEPILAAPDREDLLDWLRHRPVFHREENRVLVHAGLLPRWTLEEAESLARGIEAVLQGSEGPSFLRSLYPLEKVLTWNPDGSESDRLRAALAILTRIRVVAGDDRVLLDEKGAPGDAREPAVPWFEAPSPRDPKTTVYFGHWSALGFHRKPGAVGLDSGCVWGGALTALRLEDGRVFSARGTEPPV